MSYDPTLDKSVVDLENFNYEESEIDSASDTEEIKSENSVGGVDCADSAIFNDLLTSAPFQW